MKTIYKYELKTTEEQVITMPMEAKILSLQIQNGIPCIWAEVVPSKEVVDITFATFGTGHQLPDKPMKYIGTYQLDNGIFVFHVFEIL